MIGPNAWCGLDNFDLPKTWRAKHSPDALAVQSQGRFANAGDAHATSQERSLGNIQRLRDFDMNAAGTRSQLQFSRFFLRVNVRHDAFNNRPKTLFVIGGP